MSTPSDDPQEIIRNAMAALKRGDTDTARRLAEQAANLEPASERPWLILAALAGPEESVAYIQRALQVNPESQQARQALEWALRRAPAQPAPEVVEQPAEGVPLSEEPAGPIPLPEAQPALVLTPSDLAVPVQAPGDPAALANTQPIKVGPSPASRQGKRFSFSDPRKRPFVWAGLAVIVLLVILVMAQPQIAALFRPPVPTPQCIEPHLVVGSSSFRIQSVSQAADRPLPAAPQDPGVALWVNGTSSHYVMLLNPSTQNQSLLASLQAGAVISINWADCTQEAYAMRALDVRPAFSLSQVDRSHGGITLLLFMDDTGRAMVMTSGALTVPTATSKPTATFAPGATSQPAAATQTPPPGLQADISFLETTPSADGKTLRLVIEIKNVGSAPLSLLMDDFSLAPDGSPDQRPTSTDPSLPLQIPPGETRTLALAFPHPGGNIAVFRLQDFTTEIYY